MNPKKPKNVRGRWMRGNVRYTEKQEEELRSYREPEGWFRGARVWKK